ncbi:MAG: sugar kinase [Elusimicrobia bacterium]|nr:sugar kinase [Elusimicrobiota bacterium]
MRKVEKGKVKRKVRKIVVVGSIARDWIKTPFARVSGGVGGSSIYFSLAASLFSPVGIVGVIGRDFPEKFLKKLSRRGIDTSGIKREKKGETFQWEGEYSWDLNIAKTIDTRLNVFAEFSPRIPAEFLSSEFLFLANIDPVLQMKVLKEVKNAAPKCFVAGDTMNFWIESKKRHLSHLIGKLDAMLINEAEIRQFTGMNNLIKAAGKIISMGAKIVVVKRGEYGVSCFSGNRIFSLPAFPLASPVDPTGAGDSFAGAFMGYIASCGSVSWKELKKAVAWGTVVSSFTVEGIGVRRLVSVGKNEINSRYRKFVRMVHFEKI